MNESLQTQYGYGGSDLAVERQRVLRNTYWLLALSLVPTVLGAWVGVSTNLFMQLGMGGSLLLMIGGGFGLLFAIRHYKDSGAGVVALLAFTFLMGMMLSPLLIRTLAFRNGGQLIMLAFGGTSAIFFALASLATVIKRDLSSLGKFAFVGLIVLLVAGIANIFFQSTAMTLTVLALSMAVFSAFLLFDMKRIIDGGETNYITATLSIYLDLINLFQSLLSLLGIFGGERE
jgi:modulator of FtsH protease